MDEKLEPRKLQEIASKLGINQPVMSQRVVGSRIELHLLGGSEIVLEAQDGAELEKLDYQALYDLAKAYGIPGRSKMNREELLFAIRRELG